MTAYRLKEDSTISDAKKGDLVFSSSGYDYGMASDDTAMTGIQHISVTTKRSGAYPTFTIPLRDLEEVEMPEAKYPDDVYVAEVCKMGQGNACCRYLTMHPKGWSCEKLGNLKDTLDRRVEADTINAKGDNCEGLDCR